MRSFAAIFVFLFFSILMAGTDTSENITSETIIPPPPPPPLEAQSYRKTGSGLLLAPGIEAAIQSYTDKAISYVSSARVLRSRTHDYLYLKIGIGEWNGNLMARKPSEAMDWNQCKLFYVESEIEKLMHPSLAPLFFSEKDLKGYLSPLDSTILDKNNGWEYTPQKPWEKPKTGPWSSLR